MNLYSPSSDQTRQWIMGLALGSQPRRWKMSTCTTPVPLNVCRMKSNTAERMWSTLGLDITREILNLPRIIQSSLSPGQRWRLSLEEHRRPWVDCAEVMTLPSMIDELRIANNSHRCGYQGQWRFYWVSWLPPVHRFRLGHTSIETLWSILHQVSEASL